MWNQGRGGGGTVSHGCHIADYSDVSPSLSCRNRVFLGARVWTRSGQVNMLMLGRRPNPGSYYAGSGSGFSYPVLYFILCHNYGTAVSLFLCDVFCLFFVVFVFVCHKSLWRRRKPCRVIRDDNQSHCRAIDGGGLLGCTKIEQLFTTHQSQLC